MDKAPSAAPVAATAAVGDAPPSDRRAATFLYRGVEVLQQGPLFKASRKLTAWRKRWSYVPARQAHTMVIKHSEKGTTTTITRMKDHFSANHYIDLHSASVEPGRGDFKPRNMKRWQRNAGYKNPPTPYWFSIRCPKHARTFYFATDSPASLRRWVEQLRYAINPVGAVLAHQQLGELGAPVESSSDEMDEKKEENGRPGDDAAADSGSGVVAGAAGQRLQQEAEQKKREALIADLHGPEPGDWRVIVHVLQVRQMLPAERHAQVSPTVKMKCFGKTRNTRIANGRPSALFDELFFFERRGCTAEDVQDAQITFTVQNAAAVALRRKPMGSFTFRLSQVYYQPDHQFQQQWVAIVEGGANTTRGYLQVSICCLGPSDQPKEWDTRIDPDSVDFLSKVMMPPSVKSRRETRWVVATIYQAEDLPRVSSSTVTGFRVQLTAGDVVVKTQRREPPQRLLGTTFWNEAMLVPVQIPAMPVEEDSEAWLPHTRLVIDLRFFHAILKTSAEPVCTFPIYLDELDRYWSVPVWVPLYGPGGTVGGTVGAAKSMAAAVSGSRKSAQERGTVKPRVAAEHKMRHDPSFASHYCGLPGGTLPFGCRRSPASPLRLVANGCCVYETFF